MRRSFVYTEAHHHSTHTRFNENRAQTPFPFSFFSLFLSHSPACKPMGGRHVLPASFRLGSKAKDGKALVGVRGKNVGNCRDGSEVGRGGGTVDAKVMVGVGFI